MHVRQRIKDVRHIWVGAPHSVIIQKVSVQWSNDKTAMSTEMDVTHIENPIYLSLAEKKTFPEKESFISFSLEIVFFLGFTNREIALEHFFATGLNCIGSPWMAHFYSEKVVFANYITPITLLLI